jgi:hypothetical protein
MKKGKGKRTRSPTRRAAPAVRLERGSAGSAKSARSAKSPRWEGGLLGPSFRRASLAKPEDIESVAAFAYDVGRLENGGNLTYMNHSIRRSSSAPPRWGYHERRGERRSLIVHATDGDLAVERLGRFLGYPVNVADLDRLEDEIDMKVDMIDVAPSREARA